MLTKNARLIAMVAAAVAMGALAGCASHAPAAALPETRQVPIDNANVEAVQAAGYKLVNKDGVDVYCRTDKLTGSHVQTRTTCLTRQELEEQISMTRNNMERSMQTAPRASASASGR